MPNLRDPELMLLAELRHAIEAAKAQLQQARTKEARDAIGERIYAWTSRERQISVARRRRAAARRRWERINGITWPHPTFPPHDPSVQYLFSDKKDKKIEPPYDDEWLAVEEIEEEGCALEEIPGEAAFDFVQRVAREYAKIKAGDHKSVRRVLQRAYLAARKMQREPNQFDRLKDDPFWNASLHRPNDTSTSKWVLFFIMQARTPNERYLASKYVAIIDGLMRDKVSTTDLLVARMEGVEAAYEAWRARKRLRGLKSESQRQGGNG
jgi:hypothetical protein